MIIKTNSIKKHLLFLLVLMLIFSCKKEKKHSYDPPSSKAEQVLKRSLEYHGEMFYDDLESLEYNKNYTLFLEDGSIEKSVEERHSYNFKTQDYQITSINKSDTTVTRFIDGNYFRTINGDSITIESSKIKKAINASTYVIGIPYVLKYDRNLLRYEGLLASGEEVISIHYNTVENQNHSSSEVWKFNIDSKGKVLSNLIYSKDHISLVENTSFQKVGDIIWYKNRKSYRVDSLGNKLYVRAEYLYEDFSPKFKM